MHVPLVYLKALVSILSGHHSALTSQLVCGGYTTGLATPPSPWTWLLGSSHQKKSHDDLGELKASTGPALEP